MSKHFFRLMHCLKLLKTLESYWTIEITKLFSRNVWYYESSSLHIYNISYTKRGASFTMHITTFFKFNGSAKVNAIIFIVNGKEKKFVTEAWNVYNVQNDLQQIETGRNYETLFYLLKMRSKPNTWLEFFNHPIWMHK